MNAPASLKSRLIVPLSLLFLLLATTLAGGSLWNTRDFLARQLEHHAQDAATTLSLRLAPHFVANDAAAIASHVDALFDSGDFLRIQLANARGDPMLDRVRAPRLEDAPAWFVERFSLPLPVGLAEVGTEWRIVGQIAVTSHPGLAYRQLWRTTLATLSLALAGWLLASLLVYLTVRVSLRPLADMENLARRVAAGEFPRLKREARVRELRHIGFALDDMSQALARMLAEKTQLIASLERELNHDAVTGLINRRALVAHLEAILAEHDGAPRVLAIGRLAGFAAFNRGAGRAAGDHLLREVAAAWSRAPAAGLAARLDGPQFALLLEAPDAGSARVTLQELAREAQAAAAAAGLDFHVGAADGRKLAQASAWLGRVDGALMEAERRQAGAWLLEEEAAVDAEALDIDMLLRGEALELDLQDVVAHDGVVLAREALARLRIGEQRLSLVTRLGEARARGLLPRLDRLALVAAAEVWLREFPPDLPISVNVDAASLLAGEAAIWLTDLPLHCPEIRGKLLLELPLDALRAPTIEAPLRALREHGVGLVVNRFSLATDALDLLARLRPEWVKLDAALIRASLQTPGNRLLLTALCEYARGLKIRVCACGVETEPMRREAEAAGCDAAQGYAVAPPLPVARG